MDTTPPESENCPDDILEIIELGLDGTVVFYAEPTATDISGTVNLDMRSNGPGDFFVVGVTQVIYIFSDPSGNTFQCDFVINVVTGEVHH